MQEFKIRKDLPKALTSGERQVRTDLSEIEHFHKWRYEQAKAFVPDGVTVLDLGCGVGYGSFMLSEKNVTVTGVDIYNVGGQTESILPFDAGCL